MERGLELAAFRAPLTIIDRREDKRLTEVISQKVDRTSGL
jgi:hypothetical protein